MVFAVLLQFMCFEERRKVSEMRGGRGGVEMDDIRFLNGRAARTLCTAKLAVGLLVGFSLFHTQKKQFSTNIIFENRHGT